jgi:REP element-mobilizing transposase RayT
MDKFNGRYRIHTTRLQNWDYGWNAPYFITICTLNREHFFGEISNATMHMSQTGKLAQQYWYEIPEKFPFVKLDVFVVMPNHIHGIVTIDKTGCDGGKGCRDAINRVSTAATTNTPGGITGNKNPMLHDNLSRVIRWYKGRVSFECRKYNPMFAWQSRFYDHIIRNDKSFQRISEYIRNNPKFWREDKFSWKQHK